MRDGALAPEKGAHQYGLPQLIEIFGDKVAKKCAEWLGYAGGEHFRASDDLEAEYPRLAALSPGDYDRVRAETAKTLGIRVKTLDEMAALAARAQVESQLIFPSWSTKSSYAATDIIACKNGLLHIPTRALLPHT